MAGGNVVEVIARVKADVSQAQQNFKALGDQFKKLKLGEGLTRNLEADFKNLEKSFSNYFEKLDVGATGKASVKELNDITSASQALDKAIARLLADWEKIGERDLRRSLDLSGLEKDRKEVEDLANSLDTKLKTAMTVLKEGGKDLNAVGLRDYGKALSEAAKSIKEGDLGAAGQKYEEVYNGLAKRIEEVNQEIKDTQSNAAKQQENLAVARANIKIYEDIRRAVNDAYGPDTRKQIEATMAAIQTSRGKGGVGGLGQKLQDKFGNLPEIQGQLKNFISMLQQPWKGNNIEEIGKSFTELRDKIKEVGGDSLARSFSQLIGPSTQQKLKGQVDEIKANIQSLLPTFQQVSNSLSQGQIKEKFDQMVSAISQGDIGALSNYMNTLGDAIAKVQKQVQAGGSDTTALEKELETLKNVQTAIGNAFGANSQQYISETSQKLKEFRESLDDKQKAIFDQLAGSIQRLGENGQRAGEQVRTANEGLRESANAAAKSKSELEQVIQSFARFTTLAGIMDIFRNSIRAAFNAVKELDEAMNSIAVVTDMTTQDLWDQIDVYTQMANATGSTIAGAYQVAQLYYQQGLSTNDVMTATTETLKLARVAAIDYASATDYMTSAVKGFGLSYQDLSHIMDVYSNLAAKTAADTEEISIAMSKVASIAHSTGMELETTAGFLTQIIATTREAPETAGTSLKTVIARFAEVKKLVSQGVNTGTDEEGTEIDVNKIETALRLAGVALRDSQGQMRDLDDVFIELSSHWAELDTLTQRYIATQAAGSRQQSRFLAMISDYDSLVETLGYATDAAGANNEQFGKTLDSLESKLNGLQNAWTEFTTGIANQSVIKGAVDILTTLLGLVNDLTGVFGNFGGAIAKTIVLWGGLKLGGSALGTIANSVLGLDLKTKSLSSTFNSLLIPSIVKAATIGSTKAKIADAMAASTLKAEVAAKLAAGELTKEAAAAEMAALSSQNAITGTNGLTQVLVKLAAGLGTTVPVILAVVAAIGAGIAIFAHFHTSAKEAAQALDEYNQSLNDSTEAIATAKQGLEEIQDITENGLILFDDKGAKKSTNSIQELANGVDKLGNNISLSEEQFQGYQDILQRLVDIGFAESIEDVNAKLKDTSGTDAAIKALQEYQKELERTIKLQAIEARQNYGDKEEKGWENQKAEAQKAIDRKKLQQDSQGLEIEAFLQPKDYDFSKAGITDDELIKAGVMTKETLVPKIDKSNLEAWKSYIEELYKLGDEDTVALAGKIQEQIISIESQFEEASAIQENIIQSFYDDSLDIISGQTQDYQLQLEQLGLDPEAVIKALMGSSEDWANSENTVQDIVSKMSQFSRQLKDAGITELKLSDGTLFEDIKQEDYSTEQEYLDAKIKWLKQYWAEHTDGILDLTKIFGESGFNNFASGMGYDPNYTPAAPQTEGQVGLSKDAQIVYDDLNDTIGDQIQLAGVADRNIRILSNDYVELAKKVDNVNEVFDDNEDILKEANRGSLKYERALDDVADAIEDAFDVDVTRDWVDENKDLIDGIDESEDGFNKFAEALVNSNSEISGYADQIFSAGTAVKDVASLVQGLGDAGAFDLKGYASLDTSNIIGQLSAALVAGHMTADEFNAIMSALGYEVQFGPPTEVKGPDGNTMVSVPSSISYKRISGGGLFGYTGGGGGSGGGGGGSEKENNATFGQDPFYNYIKTVDQYTHSLEALERELDILSDKDAVRDNLSAQEEEYKRVIGANQSYLNEVNRQLGYMQEEGMEKWGAYLDFAEDGSLRLNEAYFNLTGDTVEELDDWIDAYDDLLGRQTDLNEELDDYKKELKDLWEGWRDDYIDILEQLTDILQREDEKALEEKEKFYEKLEQQSQDYLDAVRKNIEAERDARDKANSYEDLSKKQKRLSLLQRDTSGRYSSEIQSLQEEIANAQQELADQQVDDMLQQLEDQMDADERRHSETLDMMQKQIDEYVETRAYIKEAEEIIAQGDEAILAKLMQGEDYLQASDAERQKMLDEWGPQIGSLNKYVEYLGEGIVTATQYIAKMMTDGLTQATAAVVQAVGSISPTVVVNIGGGGGGGGGGPSGGGGCSACMGTCSGVCRNNNENIATACRGNCSGSCSYAGRGLDRYKYATGGLVDYTGPAWVDGTKSKPEAFLNANQTSLIGSFAKSLERLSGTTSGSTFQGIGDCTIDITIGSIGKDYDIDQAIAKVKDEIVRSTEYRNVNILKRGR